MFDYPTPQPGRKRVGPASRPQPGSGGISRRRPNRVEDGGAEGHRARCGAVGVTVCVGAECAPREPRASTREAGATLIRPHTLPPSPRGRGTGGRPRHSARPGDSRRPGLRAAGAPVTRAGPEPSRSAIPGRGCENQDSLPDTAPLPFFFFRLFFLAASSAVLEVPSSLSSGSTSPFRWLPKDAASSTPAMLPERASGGVRARGADPLLLHPPPPAMPPEVALDGRDAGNAGTAEDSAARGPSARPPPVRLASAGVRPDASVVPNRERPLRASSGARAATNARSLMFPVFKNPKRSD